MPNWQPTRKCLMHYHTRSDVAARPIYELIYSPILVVENSLKTNALYRIQFTFWCSEYKEHSSPNCHLHDAVICWYCSQFECNDAISSGYFCSLSFDECTINLTGINRLCLLYLTKTLYCIVLWTYIIYTVYMKWPI